MPNDVWSFPGKEDPGNTGSQVANNFGAFVGEFSDVSGFGGADIVITASPGGVVGFVTLYWGEDGSSYVTHQAFTIALSPTPFVLSVPTFLSFLKVQVDNNSASNQTINVTTFLRPQRPPAFQSSGGFVPQGGEFLFGPELVQTGQAFAVTDYGTVAPGRVSIDPLTVTARADGTYAPGLLDSRGARFVQQRNGFVEARTVKTALLDSNATNGNVTLVGAVLGKKIRVLRLMLSNNTAAVQLKLTDGAGGATLYGTVSFPAANSSMVDAAPTGAFICETTAGNGLVLNANNATVRSAHVTYIEV